jgi:presenilin 1
MSDRSIKLGLGDFVFYSVLVSKAALYGFSTAAVCFLVIVIGLGSTLVLLSVYQMALPALPISIGLGVAFYFGTRVFVVPMLEALAATPVYF